MAHHQNKKESYTPITPIQNFDDRFDDIDGTSQGFPTHGNDRKQLDRDDAFARPEFNTGISEQTGRKIGKHVLDADYTAAEVASHQSILNEQERK